VSNWSEIIVVVMGMASFNCNLDRAIVSVTFRGMVLIIVIINIVILTIVTIKDMVIIGKSIVPTVLITVTVK